VSDLGDGSKSVTKHWQPFASAMAASVVHNMFKQAHVIKNWPHYKNIDPGMTEGRGMWKWGRVGSIHAPIFQQRRQNCFSLSSNINGSVRDVPY
jgi:hypothetical protein